MLHRLWLGWRRAHQLTIALIDSESRNLSYRVVMVLAEHHKVRTILHVLDDLQLLVEVVVLAARLHDLSDGRLSLADRLDRLRLQCSDLQLLGGNLLL